MYAVLQCILLIDLFAVKLLPQHYCKLQLSFLPSLTFNCVLHYRIDFPTVY